MIAPVYPRGLNKGAPIETPWSAHVIVKEVLVVTQVDDWIFYGVLAETQDGKSWDWLSIECLLWVFEDGLSLRLWQHSSRPSPFSLQEPEVNLESIVGHYESSNGQYYVAVKWKDCHSPTWELEQDMAGCGDAVTDYFIQSRP